MPQTGQEPYHKDVPLLIVPVAAEGDVDVIAEERAEGHVPPPPEFGRTPGNQGIIEVFEEAEAEHPSETDRHIGVAGEVKVKLERIEQRACPVGDEGHVRQSVERGDGKTAAVGDQNLFGKPDGEAEHPVVEVLHLNVTVGKLFFDVLIADNRTRDKLREERNVQQEGKEGFLHLRVVAVHVDDVGHGLEGEEADPDGHGQRDHGNLRVEDHIERLGEEAEIFIYPEDAEVERDRRDQPQSFCHGGVDVVDQETEEVVAEHQPDHQEDRHRFAPCVEQKGKRGQHDPPIGIIFYEEICQKQGRHKDVQKQEMREKHDRILW